MDPAAISKTQGSATDILVFRVGEVLCGIDISSVQEINRNMDITRVFAAPSYVRGVINLRGQIVTIVDLGRRLGVSSLEEPASPKNVVVRSRGEDVGLWVDDIDDIVTVGKSGILPAPPHLPQALAACAIGVLTADNGLVVVLDVDCAAA